jgi:hypothetical protein
LECSPRAPIGALLRLQESNHSALARDAVPNDGRRALAKDPETERLIAARRLKGVCFASDAIKVIIEPGKLPKRKSSDVIEKCASMREIHVIGPATWAGTGRAMSKNRSKSDGWTIHSAALYNSIIEIFDFRTG